MKLYLSKTWDALSTSFWFVPSAMVLFAFGLSLAQLGPGKGDILLCFLLPRSAAGA